MECYVEKAEDKILRVFGRIRTPEGIQRRVQCFHCEREFGVSDVQTFFVQGKSAGFVCSGCESRQKYEDLPMAESEFDCPLYTCTTRHQHIPEGPACPGM